MNKLLRLGDVKNATGLSRSSIYSYMEQSTFPRQIKIGPRSVAWLEADIEEWITQRRNLSTSLH